MIICARVEKADCRACCHPAVVYEGKTIRTRSSSCEKLITLADLLPLEPRVQPAVQAVLALPAWQARALQSWLLP